MATDLHSGLARRQPLPRRFRIPFDDTPRIFAAHAGTRTNHGTFQPCAGTSVASVHLYKAGASQYINSFVLPLSYSAQERPLPQAYAPCGCEARGHAYWCRRLGSNQRPEPDICLAPLYPTELRLHEGGRSSFRAASQSCDGAQALLRQQSFKRSRTHLLEGELNDLAFGHVSMCPQLQHRGLRGLLQDFASPIRLFRYTLVTRGVHVELEVSVGIGPTTCSLRMSCSAS